MILNRLLVTPVLERKWRWESTFPRLLRLWRRKFAFRIALVRGERFRWRLGAQRLGNTLGLSPQRFECLAGGRSRHQESTKPKLRWDKQRWKCTNAAIPDSLSCPSLRSTRDNLNRCISSSWSWRKGLTALPKGWCISSTASNMCEVGCPSLAVSVWKKRD